MKSFRLASLVALLGAQLTISFAADSGRLYLAYGDSSFAGLNGAASGDEINKSNVQIPVLGSTFRVAVYMHNTSSASVRTLGGNLHLNFDRASGVAGGVYTNTLDNKLSASNWTLNNLAHLGSLNDGREIQVQMTALGSNSKRISALPTLTNGKEAGHTQSWQVKDVAGIEPGSGFLLAGGERWLIGYIDIKNTGVTSGIYGDSSEETGLTFTLGRSSFGSAFADGVNREMLNQKIGVYSAVPEPGTMAVLAAGVAVLARRRRK